MSFEIDTSDLRRLSADLGQVPARAARDVETVLAHGAVNLKRSMQAAFARSPHFKAVARDVSYDRRGFASEIAFEVGPTMHGAGALGHIAVDGGANGGGGSVDIDELLPPEAAAVERFVGEILGGLL
ncbi:MAG: hypothetical protein FWF90_11405 [Promicromonosporaceae bacterium]|nr:hypothetical protein [Promicromonosporaceae bacterium]